MVNENFAGLMRSGLFKASETPRGVDGEMCSSNSSRSEWQYYFEQNSKNLIGVSYEDFNSASGGGSGILLGDSDIAPTVEDYKLGNIISDYTVLSQSHTSISAKFTTSPYVFTSTRVIYNSTDSPITVKEVGLFGAKFANSCFMIAREVLDEPAVIQPGEKYSFTMVISIE